MVAGDRVFFLLEASISMGRVAAREPINSSRDLDRGEEMLDGMAQKRSVNRGT